jgi:hypothetical protein
MPWCPKCKTEYEDGIKECVDCKEELVDDLEESKIEWSQLAEGVEEHISKLDAFLKYSNITTLVETMEENKLKISVLEKQEKEAKKLFQVFKKSTDEENQKNEPTEEMFEEDDTQAASGNVYMDELDKVNEVKSSASAFLFVGIIGFIALTACALGFIDLNMEGFNKYMFFGVMYTLIIVFLLIGIQSALKVGSMKKAATVAKSKEDEIKEWFINKYSASFIDEDIEEVDETEKYFPRAAKIKAILLEREPNLSVDQVEKYTEELYEKLFC